MTERDADGPPALLPGDRLAPDYRVVAHLRRGEDLDVYDLWSDVRGCRCIGKTLRPDRLNDATARARLMREGKLLVRLTHPHIVRAYEVLAEPAPAIIEETLPGETLAHLIDRQARGLRAADVAQLGLHLCSALGYLHRQGWLHLDIKPSNIVSARGVAKVLDLSLARAPGRVRGGSGTPGYMAPEQIEGGMVGFHTDVWGLGATLYEAATGEPASGEPESDEPEDASEAYHPPEPVRRARRLPSPLADVIDRSLARNSGDRPTIDEIVDQLQFVISTNEARSRDGGASGGRERRGS